MTEAHPLESTSSGHAAGQSRSQAPGAGDHAWALKRDWTDTPFQSGAEANKVVLQGFEELLVGCLQRSWVQELGLQSLPEETCSRTSDSSDDVLAEAFTVLSKSAPGRPSEQLKAAVLGSAEVLGSSLDIVGAYLKNYEVDRAACVLETVLPYCRRKGGLWELKALNHLATVRMKQARPEEALATLRELEALVQEGTQDEAEDAFWEFWETVYRNIAWALAALKREDEAIAYSQKAVEVKQRVGREASWFDLWDLGRNKAVKALRAENAEMIAEAQALITKALWQHREVERDDIVMRAKIWHSVGECSFSLGFLADGSSQQGESPTALFKSRASEKHFRKALKCFKESYGLFRKTEGRRNALTGQEAQAVAWTLFKLGDVEETKTYLLDALEALATQQNGWGDGDSEAPALMQAMQTADRLLEAHRRTSDREGLQKYFAPLEQLCANVWGRLCLTKDGEQAVAYEKMVSSCSMLMTASGTDEGFHAGQQLFRKYMWSNPRSEQAQLCMQVMSLKDGHDSSAAGYGASPAPDSSLLARALAEIQHA
eukprot:TRINITY_DN37216_c0_g1_i1.p2 TRINITY_DN37216_c0_g1~~TRINITY_DN37216_c0_g1_i1.p2  ORF type:complete len:545 (+),score=159.15 TRINITY_DN37216_c0_g1_i1:93-1727(+)